MITSESVGGPRERVPIAAQRQKTVTRLSTVKHSRQDVKE